MDDRRGLRARDVLTLLIGLAVAASTSAHALGGQDDAGSGGDAGDTWSTALEVSNPSSFQGNLSSASGVDVFRWDAKHTGQAYCAQAIVSTGSAVDADLVVVNANTQQVEEVLAHPSFASGPSRLGVVNHGADGGFLKVSGNSLTNAVSASYDATLSYLTTSMVSSADSGTSGDAPSGASGAPSVSGACFGGRVGGGDAADTFTFLGQAGSTITITLSDTDGTVQGALYDASGTLLGTLGSDGILTQTLSSTGSYSMTMSASSSPTTYLAGLCAPQCGPPEQPCNPMCALAFD